MDSSYLAARCRGRLGVFATSSLASSSWKEVLEIRERNGTKSGGVSRKLARRRIGRSSDE